MGFKTDFVLYRLYGDVEAIMEQNQRHFETLLAEHEEGSSAEERDDVEEGTPFCIVCNKSFKTELVILKITN